MSTARSSNRINFNLILLIVAEEKRNTLRGPYQQAQAYAIVGRRSPGVHREADGTVRDDEEHPSE